MKNGNKNSWKPAVDRALRLPTFYIAQSLGCKISDVATSALQIGLRELFTEYARTLQVALGPELYIAIKRRLEENETVSEL
jgi:hypothetical protein